MKTKRDRRSAVTMKGEAMATAFRCGVLLGLGCVVFVGCWEGNPCDPGQVVRLDQCVAAPTAAPTSSPDAGEPSADAAGGDAPIDNFGMTCASASDCAGGTAPVCGAPQLPMCTQVLCQAGEANAGACPMGWQCVAIGSNPSVCLKQ